MKLLPLSGPIAAYKTDPLLDPAYETCTSDRDFSPHTPFVEDQNLRYDISALLNVSHTENSISVGGEVLFFVNRVIEGSSYTTCQAMTIDCPFFESQINVNIQYMYVGSDRGGRAEIRGFAVSGVAPDVTSYETTLTVKGYADSAKKQVSWTAELPLILKFEPASIPHALHPGTGEPSYRFRSLLAEPDDPPYFTEDGIPSGDPNRTYTVSFQKPREGAPFGENALLFHLKGTSNPGTMHHGWLNPVKGFPLDLKHPDEDTGFGPVKYLMPVVCRFKFDNTKHAREFKKFNYYSKSTYDYPYSLSYFGTGPGTLSAVRGEDGTTYTVTWEMTDANEYYKAAAGTEQNITLRISAKVDGQTVPNWGGGSYPISVGTPQKPGRFQKNITVPVGGVLEVTWNTEASINNKNHDTKSLPQTKAFYNKDEGGGGTLAKLYGSVNGQAKEVTKLYGSVNGQAKRISKLYASVEGKAKLIYQEEGGA